jgi:hypothetical protein
LGGFSAQLADFAVTIPAFNRVPVTLVVWKGDEEFPSDASVLFDSTKNEYLPAEDIIVVCQTSSGKMIRIQQSLQQNYKLK